MTMPDNDKLRDELCDALDDALRKKCLIDIVCRALTAQIVYLLHFTLKKHPVGMPQLVHEQNAVRSDR
jgi:hypothetical protein